MGTTRNATRDAAAPQECPACGAPLRVRANGTVARCRVCAARAAQQFLRMQMAARHRRRKAEPE
jgi:hypothetical protein